MISLLKICFASDLKITKLVRILFVQLSQQKHFYYIFYDIFKYDVFT